MVALRQAGGARRTAPHHCFYGKIYDEKYVGGHEISEESRNYHTFADVLNEKGYGIAYIGNGGGKVCQ